MKALFQSYQSLAEASIAQAKALPFAVYHDKSVYEEETKQVFRSEWVFACAEQQLSKPGDYFAFDMAGELIAIIRGKDGTLRALSNVCRHRGTPLLDDGFGNIERNIVCPYHAWTYDDQGKLKGVPFPGDVVVDKEEHCLPGFQLESWMGLLFVNLSDKPLSLSERLRGIKEYLAFFQPERFSNGYHGETEHWQANWKLAVENGIESYHLFKVHKDTLETVTPSKQSFYVAGSSEWAITGGRMVETQSKLMKWLSGSHPEAYNHYLLIFLPPSFIGIMTYESFDWIQVLPDGPERCVIRSGGIMEYSGSYKDKALEQFNADFMAEDKAICERVQRGMHAQTGHGGKLVSMEKVVVDFRQFLASRLFNSVPDDFFQSEQAHIFLTE
ncbi:aromatic ring-hydroxylating dioxygenase subunit alpha [Pleionea sp. CnH1-48]|uniref:aromatic ring-hydroxylating oxygenase subunit alpha n=1 Tax=Pleionea sp. CnH1-48 TaxID=2954494 RepID=UPI0020978053|nr:aromatic ring-hydroxylating dioxygenase subunit alpha [Pleionea sp. CnH1-48]MCO7224942.1 aromatic ring-hydroxylating dioxygenase subunit alpha [Pleionea sp. CnH1-48]